MYNEIKLNFLDLFTVSLLWLFQRWRYEVVNATSSHDPAGHWTVLDTSRPQPAHIDLLLPATSHLSSWLTAH